VHELNMFFGDGELYRLFFRWRSSEAKLTRRRRIRLLTKLNRLTEVHPIEVFSERGSPVHAELIEIYGSSRRRRLLRQRTLKCSPALVRTRLPVLRTRRENATINSDRAGLVCPLGLPLFRRLPARCNRRSLGCGRGLARLDRLRAACGIRSSCRPVF